MIKEIKYNGHSASPSDYQSPDGDMASMLNCIPERGALKPILPPKTVKSFGKYTTVLAIHKVANREHYILYAGTVLTWVSVDDGDPGNADELDDFSDDGGVVSVTPIGNTLAVLDGNGTIHYFLWRNDAYSNLGTQLPELEVSPYIRSEVFSSAELNEIYPGEGVSENNFVSVSLKDKLLFDTFKEGSEYTFDNEEQETIYEPLFALLNPCLNVLARHSFFTFPFFVRFAYRLYDGSHTMHTVPFLMVPIDNGQPYVFCNNNGGDKPYNLTPLFVGSQLNFKFVNQPSISNWKDIITHIDVFVTPHLVSYTDSSKSLLGFTYRNYTFDDTKTCNNRYLKSIAEEYISKANNNTDNFVLVTSEIVRARQTLKMSTNTFDNYLVVECYGTTKDAVTARYDTIWSSDIVQGVDLSSLPENFPNIDKNRTLVYKPSRVQTKPIFFETSVAENQASFRVYQYRKTKANSINDITGKLRLNFTRVDGKSYSDVVVDYNNFYKVSEIDVNTIVDKLDYDYSCVIKENTLNKLTTFSVLSNTGQQRFDIVASGLFAYNNRINIYSKGERPKAITDFTTQGLYSKATNTGAVITDAFVEILENSQTIYQKILLNQKYHSSGFIFQYISYPRSTATAILIKGKIHADDTGGYYRIPLTKHPFLNIAYAFNNMSPIKATPIENLPDTSESLIRYGNKIYVSNVNNPFIFSEENTSELPVGEIYALSTAAKALSQGQFGQFPLYAFTDKGVWALEVTGTGTYSARQPITRDVVLDAKSVTQIDEAVLFATERGIMLLSGSQVQCISEVLDGKEFDITQLEFAYKKISENSKALDTVSWDTYKANIQMLYGYTGQRIIVFNPEYDHAYVFSLESKQWGIMESKIQSTVNYYPRAYAMTCAGNLVDYSVTDEDFAEGYYITRPLKLDAPDLHKTITGIIQRGQFKKGHVNTMLYGSRDLDKWYPVYGSNDHILRGMRGTPYKYFRIASTFHLECDESITGCSVDFEPRLNNKLR